MAGRDAQGKFTASLEDDVTPQARRADKSLARLQKTIEKFNKSSIGKATQKFATWSKDILTIGAAVGAGLAGAIGAATVSMVDFNQRSKLGFQALAQAGEDPQESFQRTIDLIKQFGFDMKETTQAVLQFKASGFSQDQSERLLKMGADMRVLGANSEQVGRAFLAINQIKSAGTLQGDELNQLAEAGVPKAKVYEELAKALGKTVPEILKLKEAGKIESNDAINAIGSAMLSLSGGKDFGDAGGKAARETLSGATGILKAGWDDMFRRAAEGSEGSIVAALGPIATELNQLFNDPRFAAGISTFVSGIGDFIREATPMVKDFLKAFGSGAGEAFSVLSDAIGPIFALFKGDGPGTANIIKTIGTALGQLTVFAGAIIVVLGAMAAAVTVAFVTWKTFMTGLFNTVTNIMGSIVAPFVMAFESIAAILDSSGMSLFDKAIGIGKAIIQGVMGGLKAMAMAPVELIKGYATSWIQAAEVALGIRSPSKVFEQIGNNVGLGMTIGVDDSMPTVQGMAGQFGSSSGLDFTNSGASTGSSNSFQINVTAAPGATREDGQAVGQGIVDALRPFLAMLEGAAHEAGV